MNFLDVFSVQTKICANESNLTLIHSHNIELNWATKGRRKQGSNGLVSCPHQIWEKITKNCTSSSSSPMLFSTSHVLEWKSVVKNCRWLSSFARRQNKKGYCSWKVASSIWSCIVPYIGSKPFKVSPITLLYRSRMLALLKIPHHRWYFFIRISFFDTCKEIKERKSLSSSGRRYWRKKLTQISLLANIICRKHKSPRADRTQKTSKSFRGWRLCVLHCLSAIPSEQHIDEAWMPEGCRTDEPGIE